MRLYLREEICEVNITRGKATLNTLLHRQWIAVSLLLHVLVQIEIHCLTILSKAHLKWHMNVSKVSLHFKRLKNGSRFV